MMEIRLLQESEFPLLDQIGGADAVRPSPDNSIVAVAIEDGKILGRLVLMNVPHLEALWVSPDHRSGTVMHRMETLLITKLKDLGSKIVLGFAVNENMESYLQRSGYKRLASAWIKEL